MQMGPRPPRCLATICACALTTERTPAGGHSEALEEKPQDKHANTSGFWLPEAVLLLLVVGWGVGGDVCVINGFTGKRM